MIYHKKGKVLNSWRVLKFNWLVTASSEFSISSEKLNGVPENSWAKPNENNII